MITIGACSPPSSSSTMPSTLVDSASPGRNVVDSLFSASEYLPGRFAAPEASSAIRQTARTVNFALRPAANVRYRDTRRVLQQRGQLVGLCDRTQAREALAHVRGRAAVDRLASLEQRHAVG